MDNLDLVPTGKRHADRVAGEFLHEHAKSGEKEFQEP
jgi:hypothetical protein